MAENVFGEVLPGLNEVVKGNCTPRPDGVKEIEQSLYKLLSLSPSFKFNIISIF